MLVRLESFFPLAFRGLTIYIGAVTLFAEARSWVDDDSFSNADARPSGYLVSLAPDASARYSLFLEMAK